MKLSSVLSLLAAALVAANPDREKTLNARYRVVPSDLPNPGRPKEAHIWDHNAHLYGDYSQSLPLPFSAHTLFEDIVD